VIQTVVAICLVVGCAFYAVWALLPAAARRGIAVALLKQRLPAFVTRFLQRHAQAASGCGCDGCDRNVAAPPPADGPSAQGVPLVFHPRRKG
jgi:hypothetical protein